MCLELYIQLKDQQDVDLLITDIVMPKIHGIDLIMEVKNIKPNLPIIAISSGGGLSGRFDYLEIAELLGAQNILYKHFNARELRNLVHNIIGS